MTQSLDALLPTLAFLASTAGAGILASTLLDRARQHLPATNRGQVAARAAWQRWCYAALYAPQYARWTVFALAALISLAANALLAYAHGTPVNLALDAALALIISQLRHGLGLDLTPHYAADRRGWVHQSDEEFHADGE